MLNFALGVVGVLLVAVVGPLAVVAALDYVINPELRHTSWWGRGIDRLRGH